MWISFQLNNYLIKHRDEDENEVFLLTNMVNIWKCSVSQEILIATFKETNRALQWPDNCKAITCIVDLFTKESPSIKREILVQDQHVTVNASSSISGYPYGMVLSFLPMSADVLYEEFTCYLLALTSSFYKREKRLLEIIKSKDVEIEEYRQEGFEIKRRGVITAPFHFEAFDKDASETTSKEAFENPAGIFVGPIQHMLSQLQRPFIKEQPTKETAPTIVVTVEEPVKENGSSVQSPSLSDESQVEEKSEPFILRKKKKTFGHLSL